MVAAAKPIEQRRTWVGESPREAIRAFGLEPQDEPEHIYRFSPVYKFQASRRALVCKKTRSTVEGAKHIARWLRYARRLGIRVVAPISLPVENPLELAPGDVRVVYRFIPGQPYTGSAQQLRAAGRLLGRIHRAPNPKVRALGSELQRYSFARLSRRRVAPALARLPEVFSRAGLTFKAKPLLCACDRAAARSALLRHAEIPWTHTVWDFKASNLIFEANDNPVVIDPDQAQHAPRLFDLAAAVIKFHIDETGALARMWSPQEWVTFRDGYLESIDPTTQERALWGQALLLMFVQAMVVHNFHRAVWREPASRRYFLSSLAAWSKLGSLYPLIDV